MPTPPKTRDRFDIFTPEGEKAAVALLKAVLERVEAQKAEEREKQAAVKGSKKAA